ncbi:14-3-3 domain-containing protein [Cryptosporidium canis]|uniref:14-3-3 domain-containing protein n=1 Tax=Cryptosporidium canis TaxID=195482 RepID=A0ABQ8P284_9CRYT|nr:14-3-3 domain-containing protein [Cryptosporidium canis]
MNKRHTQRVEVGGSLDRGIKNVELSSNLSARRLASGNVSASRRILGSARRGSIPKLGHFSLQEFDLENDEFDSWGYYSKIEKGLVDFDSEMDEIVVDNSRLDSYVKLFNLLYSSLISSSGGYLNEMSNLWSSLLKGLEDISEMDKSVFDNLVRSFIGRVFINISSFCGAKSYYSAMIYLLISVLPNRPQIITSIRPFIIRKIIGMINETQLKRQLSQKKEQRRGKKTANKSRKKSSKFSDSDLEDEKENEGFGMDDVRISSQRVENAESSKFGLSNGGSYFEPEDGEDLILQLKLLNCIVFFCRHLDVSNNTSQAGLEGLNELIEGMSDLLIYCEDFPKNSHLNGEVSNLSMIISRMNDYSVNNSPEITSLLLGNLDYNISRIITVGFILLFINIGESRYIRINSSGGEIIKRFRTVKLENRHFEIVVYSSIILLRKMIQLTLMGSEAPSTSNGGSSNTGSKIQAQNLLIQRVFNIIKELTILFPELSHPNILFIINKIVEIQYGERSDSIKKSQIGSSKSVKSRKKNKRSHKDDSEMDEEEEEEEEDNEEEDEDNDEKWMRDEEHQQSEGVDSDKEIEEINGVEILERLKRRISSMKTREFYYIDNVVMRSFSSDSDYTGNEIFLNDPILGYILSVYLLLSEKSEARQNVLDQLHNGLIPALVEASESRNSTKMLLFDILKQTLFDSKSQAGIVVGGGGGVKEVNSFISFLSNYNIEYSIATVREGHSTRSTPKMTAFPFKFPQLLYRRIVSILPIMFHSSKPNYRIIAIDIAGSILQLRSSIELLAVFVHGISDKLEKDITNASKGAKSSMMDGQRYFFEQMISIIFEEGSYLGSFEHNLSPRGQKELDWRSSETTLTNSSRRNSSARQSIEWSGITMDNQSVNSSSILNFAQSEMAIQLYNLVVFLLERSKDVSPNIRIKSINTLSAIVSSACEIYEELSGETFNSVAQGLSLLIGDFESSSSNNSLVNEVSIHSSRSGESLLPLIHIMLECINDEKAICRKGSLILWDSLFPYLRLRDIKIQHLKKYLVMLFKSTLMDSSVLVRRHSLQSLHALYIYSPELKWVSNMWINYGLPTIMESESFLVDKTTELCQSILMEQMRKLSEFISDFDSRRNHINEYIQEMRPEYLFSWVSLRSQRENQVQIINLYRICIRNVLRKYPLVLQPLIQFLNVFIDFFAQFLHYNELGKQERGDQKGQIDFPDLPFVIMEEVYIYLSQNGLIQVQKDNILVITQRIYDILTKYIICEGGCDYILSLMASENNLLTISNSLLEIFKFLLTTYFNSTQLDNLKINQEQTKLMSLYEKIIFAKPEFYSRLTRALITYQFSNQVTERSQLLRMIASSSSLSTIVYILYLWDELNANGSRAKNSKDMALKEVVDSALQSSGTSLEDVRAEFGGCVVPKMKTEIRCIDAIYLSSLVLLLKQLQGGRSSETLNIRILGELFLLNYTITSMNSSSNSKGAGKILIVDSIESQNIEFLVPFLEELYRRLKAILLEKGQTGTCMDLESALSVLILALGQASYSTSTIAKRVIQQYLIPELQDLSSPLSIRNNILIVLHDLYILHTALVDPNLISMFNIIVRDRKRQQYHEKDSSSILRKQSLLILSDLIGQGYIKLRGSYLLRMLHSLVDRDANIRNIAHGVFERILLKTNSSILVQNFVEILCYLNNWLDHPSIKSWNLREKSVLTRHFSGSPEDFDEHEKQYILRFVFNHLSDKQKHETITRIVHDFLALFIDQSSILALPESYEYNNGKTLRDALGLLYSPDLCIYHKYSKRSYTAGGSQMDGSGKSSSKLDMESCDLEQSHSSLVEAESKTVTTNVLKELIQASLAIDIVPTLLSLKHLMKQSCSPFIKDLHTCIGQLLKDYRNNLSSIIQDNTLIKELEYDFKMGYI